MEKASQELNSLKEIKPLFHPKSFRFSVTSNCPCIMPFNITSVELPTQYGPYNVFQRISVEMTGLIDTSNCNFDMFYDFSIFLLDPDGMKRQLIKFKGKLEEAKASKLDYRSKESVHTTLIFSVSRYSISIKNLD